MKVVLRTLFLLTPAFALAAVRYAPETLVMGDKVVSHRVRMIDGESWVPVRDLATSSGMVIQRTGDQIVLTPTGGANQIGTLSGKLGETSHMLSGNAKKNCKCQIP